MHSDTPSATFATSTASFGEWMLTYWAPVALVVLSFENFNQRPVRLHHYDESDCTAGHISISFTLRSRDIITKHFTSHSYHCTYFIISCSSRSGPTTSREPQNLHHLFIKRILPLNKHCLNFDQDNRFNTLTDLKLRPRIVTATTMGGWLLTHSNRLKSITISPRTVMLTLTELKLPLQCCVSAYRLAAHPCQNIECHVLRCKIKR